MKTKLVKFAQPAIFAAALGAASSGAFAATCLTNPADTVGNAVFGATVQTFIDLGVNPNTTCIENGLWTDPSNFALGTYLKGSDGAGYGYDPTTLGAYNGPPPGLATPTRATSTGCRMPAMVGLSVAHWAAPPRRESSGIWADKPISWPCSFS